VAKPESLLSRWPFLRQVRERDAQALGSTAYTERTVSLSARLTSADKTARSVCPYCAVGCGQLVYVKDGAITDIEGDPDSPISRGRLCPKGAATFQLVTGAHRVHKVLYRAPFSRTWEPIALDKAMDMVAERVKKVRDENWEDVRAGDRAKLNRTLGFAHLGGATLDNEENYLIKKLFTALGAVQIENQARI
jgi:formate dehydrogenase major subunit